MIKEIKYCSDVMKNQFEKEHVVNEYDEDFKSFTKFWTCDNDYIDGDAK